MQRVSTWPLCAQLKRCGWRNGAWGRQGAMLLFCILVTQHTEAAQFGVYEGAGWNRAAKIPNFVAWAGRAPDRVLDFVAFGNWQQVEGTTAWGVGCWDHHGHPSLTLTLPLTTQGTDLADVAAGQFDSVFVRVANILVRDGYSDAVIRLGPEMNGSWFPWGRLANRDPARQAKQIENYKAAFRRVVGVLRSVSGARFRIDWCPAAGQFSISQPDLYPGDDVVDIIGTDLYAALWGVNHPSTQQIVAALSHGWQLDVVAEFGKQHGKPVSFPEWGVGDRPVGSANYGPGDSPQVMAYLIKWFASHATPRGRAAMPGQISYTDYWDYNAGDYNSRVSGGERPAEGAVLKDALGKGMLTGG